MTAEELLLRPDDYWRYELVDGRPVCMSATDSRRGRIVMALLRVVDRHVDKRHLGAVLPPETGFWICAPGEPDTFLAPDLAFVRTERAPDVETERFPRLAPDLVVEVASPSQRQRELTVKAERWLGAGARWSGLCFRRFASPRCGATGRRWGS
jgi:Uma2 family endonuclease